MFVCPSVNPSPMKGKGKGRPSAAKAVEKSSPKDDEEPESPLEDEEEEEEVEKKESPPSKKTKDEAPEDEEEDEKRMAQKRRLHPGKTSHVTNVVPFFYFPLHSFLFSFFFGGFVCFSDFFPFLLWPGSTVRTFFFCYNFHIAKDIFPRLVSVYLYILLSKMCPSLFIYGYIILREAHRSNQVASLLAQGNHMTEFSKKCFCSFISVTCIKHSVHICIVATDGYHS